ncbi:MAG: hypothetical protein JNL97_05640 [Verrucomicrobiales bacterium]|nr:hypothetical protein [Verrucomicrobiales bacterium]
MTRYLGVAVVVIAALVVVVSLALRDGATAIDVASPNPFWTLVVSNRNGITNVEFEVFLRAGKNVRLLRARTPAEFRLGNRRVIAQFRPVNRIHRLDLRCTRAGSGFSMAAAFDPDQGSESATFVSTFGRLGIPRMGSCGWMYPKWGARERYPSAWALWPDFWRPQTPQEEAALPPQEDWPGPGSTR